MKYVKMLGLVAVAAMALTVFFGASSASAAVLCKTDQNHCAEEWDLDVGDEITGSLTAGTQAVLKAAFSEVKCSNSHVQGHITDTGGHNRPVIGQLTTLSFTECTCGSRVAHVTTLSLGTLEVDDAGTVTSKGTRATIECTGLAKCVFGTVNNGTDVGRFTDSTDTGGAAELDAEASLTWFSGEGDSGSFVCAGFGDTGGWTASYQLTGETDELWLGTT